MDAFDVDCHVGLCFGIEIDFDLAKGWSNLPFCDLYMKLCDISAWDMLNQDKSRHLMKVLPVSSPHASRETTTERSITTIGPIVEWSQLCWDVIVGISIQIVYRIEMQ